MSTDVEVASLSILYLRARSWGIPAGRACMAALGLLWQQNGRLPAQRSPEHLCMR